MGAIASLVTFAGGICAGTGATIVTEGFIISNGSRYAATKVGKFCVNVCAMTVGGVAFSKAQDMFTEQAIEFFEYSDKLKAKLKEAKEEGVTIDISDLPVNETEKEIRDELKSEEN